MNAPRLSEPASNGTGKSRRSRTAGVAGIGDPKWVAVGLFYIAAIALMGMDPWYGEKYFTYNQGIFVGILALLLVAGFCWEIYLFGRPGGINLVLHCLLILPVALFIGRIAGLPPAPEVSYGLLGQLKNYIGSLKDASGIEGVLPLWIQDIFRNPSMLLLIFFTAVAFTQKRPSRRFALVVVAFLIPVMQSLTHEPRPSIAFGLGFLAMLVGVAIQFSKYGDVIGQQNVLTRLQAVDDRLELKCSLRIARRTVEDGFITEDGLLAVVQREYCRQFDLDALAVRGIAQAISHRLVREHRILELRGDERGFFLMPSEALCKIDSLFEEIAVWIRKIIITGIAIVWLVSPIDLFPDSIPVLGAIDDALIALVGAGQWIGTVKRRKLPKR
jgi:hypothetical protein